MIGYGVGVAPSGSETPFYIVGVVGDLAEGVGDGDGTAKGVVGIRGNVICGVGFAGDTAVLIVGTGVYSATSILRSDLTAESVVAVGGGVAAAGATGNQKTVNGLAATIMCRGWVTCDLVNGFVVAVGKGAADGGVAEMIDGTSFCCERCSLDVECGMLDVAPAKAC